MINAAGAREPGSLNVAFFANVLELGSGAEATSDRFVRRIPDLHPFIAIEQALHTQAVHP